MISTQGGRMKPIYFSELLDSNNNVKIRFVNVESEGFDVALNYMTRLKRNDFCDLNIVEKLCKISNLDESQFFEKFGYLRNLRIQ
jgi:hypothetical protein